MVIRPGRAPIRSSGGAYRAAIAFLRSLGTSAHVWLPGASGVSVASLPSNNYLLSDFATLAAVNEVVGGVKDGMNPSGGISLTQPTTANKPLVRRGAYNLAPYSDSIFGGTGLWILGSAGTTQTANNALSPSGTLTATRIVADGTGANQGIYLGAVSTVGRVEVFSLWLKGAVGGEQVMIGDASNRKTVMLTTSWVRYSDNGATRVSSNNVIYAINNTAMTFYASQAQLEAGTTAGDYTPTTATAASNPSAGKYWWSFNGSNNSLLSGNLGITNACTIVISLRVNSLAATQIIFAEDTNGAQVSIATNGAVSLTKVGGAALVTTAAGVVVAGVPLVLTVRLSAGTADIRKNGAQSATAASALTFSAVTGARVGTAFNGTSNPTGGAFGWVVPSAVGLSDADCLTVERLVGSQFPGMAVF